MALFRIRSSLFYACLTHKIKNLTKWQQSGMSKSLTMSKTKTKTKTKKTTLAEGQQVALPNGVPGASFIGVTGSRSVAGTDKKQ